MALTALLCSNNPRTEEYQKQDFKYLKATKMNHNNNDEPLVQHQDTKKTRNNNPFRRKPRGQKRDTVQVIEYPKKVSHTKSGCGMMRKKQPSGHHCDQQQQQQQQQSIGTLASGLKENGTRFLKNHHPFKKTNAKKSAVLNPSNTNEQEKETANGYIVTSITPSPTTTTTQPLPLNKTLTLNSEITSITSQLTKLNCYVSCDSGNGDDLSSSCDSSVIDNNSNGILQKYPSNVQLYQLELIVSEEEMSPEEEVFMDALSNISSDDDEYVTPLSSRSSSVICLSNNSLVFTEQSCNKLSPSNSQYSIHYPMTVDSTSSNNDDHSISRETEQLTNDDNGVDTNNESLNTLREDPSYDDCYHSNSNSTSDVTLSQCPGLLFIPDCMITQSHDTTSSDPAHDLSTERLSFSLALPQQTETDISLTNSNTQSFVNNVAFMSSDTQQHYSDSCSINDTSTTILMEPVSITHPLHYEWVLWYDKLTTGRPQFSNYAAHLQTVSSIATVEQFWSIMNNLLPPSQLVKNANYHFFKEGIQPLWEDEKNKNGGKWVITFKSHDNNTLLDRIWIEVLMALIGERFQQSHLITGIVLSRRKKGDRIAIWTTTKNKSSNLQICKQLFTVLSIACNININNYNKFISDIINNDHVFNMVYMIHKDSLRTGTSYNNEPHLTLKQHLTFMMDKTK